MPVICHTALMALQTFGFGPGDPRPDDIGSMDSDVVPVTCHWDDERYEDRCPVVLEAAAKAWAVQVDQIGFAEPILDDDGMVDIYITDWGTEGGGYTTGSYEDGDPDDGRLGGSGWIAIDPAVGVDELPEYVYHEFNHVLQMATDLAEGTLPIWEANASAAQTWTDPEGAVYPYEWRDFQKTPWLGVLGDSYLLWNQYDMWSYYEYGSEMWMRHMDAKWGDGAGAAGAALWWAAAQEGWTNEPDVLDAWDTVSGDWRADLIDLCIDRARMSTDDTPDWVGEVDNGNIGVAIDQEIDALPATVSPEVGPYETGVVYFRVTGLTEGQRLQATLTSDTDVEWAMIAVEGPVDTTATGTTLDWTASGRDALIGVVNLGAPDFDGDDHIQPADFSLELAEAPAEDTGTDGGSAEDKGCGCSGVPGRGTAWLALLPLGLLLRRRQG